MNDLEITKACAEAMGWKHLGAVGVVDPECKYARDYEAKYPGKLWCLSGGNDWWTDPEGHNVCGVCSSIPDPLNDDAQAMALVKKFRMSIGYSEGWGARIDTVGELKSGAFHYPDLNRAICECVAKMQEKK